MLKHINIIIAALLLAACAKTEVSYDSPSEIAIAPVVEGMTKAAVAFGAPTGQDLVVWANYADVNDNTTALVGDAYFEAAIFEAEGTEWVGADGRHFWPKQGSLTFAGGSKPAEGNGTVSYDYSNNTIKVTGFKQPISTAESLDLMWFNQTASANKGADGEALAVEMKHALAWVTVKAYGKDDSAAWQITGLTLDNVVLSGNVTCTTSGATWNVTETTAETKDNTANDVVIFSGTHTLGTTSYAVETVPQGTVLVPQIPKKLKVSYKTNPSSDVVTTRELDLATDVDHWEAGKHYTYEILFNPYKIIFGVTVDNIGHADKTEYPPGDSWTITTN